METLRNRHAIENSTLSGAIRLNGELEEIIGASEVFKKALDRMQQVALTDTTVLIFGESGTGKELIARAIHNISSRCTGSLVTINCAALPVTLIESELFGHQKGAFTGASSCRVGRFELAHKGTIFLDEIGDLPLELQAKMLRILQLGEFERIGGTRSIKVDVRIIAATNQNLKKAISVGRFREDLFYRLNVFPILLPPLRERREDIPLLVKYFVKKYSTRLGKEIHFIPQKLMDNFQNHTWPGNVRELQNLIERSVILSRGNLLQVDEYADIHKIDLSRILATATLRDVERAHILRVLENTNWVIEGKHGAALRLGLKPGTLRSKMKKFDIKRPGQVV